MKVTISVPDTLFRQAERVAKRLRIPRSRLYVDALASYLRTNPRPDITRRLNAVYGKKGTKPDPVILDAALEVLRRTKWED